MANKFPKFYGKPMIEIPATVPVANFLGGYFGKEFLKEYNGRVEKDYNNSNKLKVLKYENGVVKGSNVFAVVLANQLDIMKEQGLKTANQSDLEKILKTKALTLNGQYEDSGLCLRSEGDPNEYLAQHLMTQLKARGKVKLPVILNLNDLELIKDSNSNYGLAFKLKKDAKSIYAPQLDNKNHNKKFSQTDENGLPIFNKDGSRILYAANSGLSRVYLISDFDLYSRNGDLADSLEYGRVVVVSAEGTSQGLDKYISKLQQEKAKADAEIERKFQAALKLLKN